MKRYSNLTIYGVYTDTENQECIFTGSVHEIADKFGVKEDTFRSALCRTKKILVKNEFGNVKYNICKLYKEKVNE